MQKLNRQMPFTSAPNDKTEEGTSIPIRDPDTMLIMIVLLLACLALALLAHALI